MWFGFGNLQAQNQKGETPLSPQAWVEKMNMGSWWLFTYPGRADNNILTDNYSPRILDSLQQMGINGGRLHWQAKDDFDSSLVLNQQAIDYFGEIIDDMTSRGMAVCFQIHTTEKAMTSRVIQRCINGWTQVCQAYKDKSYLLAMCPVIEFHGWDDYYLVNGDTIWKTDPAYDPQVKIDSLNWLYDTLTRIFRQYNPNRIMSYKPWGSASRAKFEDLTFPFGDDPAPNGDTAFYYVASMSGSYGMGEWWRWKKNMDPDTLQMIKEQTMRSGISTTKDVGVHHALLYRESTGIPFWIDHWDPAYWKRFFDGEQAHWTIEQNLAYINFFNDTMRMQGLAGAGMQTRRFWNDKTDDLIRIGDHYLYPNYLGPDSMSVLMMQLLKSKVNIPEDSLQRYCLSYSRNESGYIKRVKLYSMDHSSTYTNTGDATNKRFYEQNYSDTLKVVRGQRVEMEVVLDSVSVDSLQKLDLYVWFDWNRDGDFGDVGELVHAENNVGRTVNRFYIEIPVECNKGLSVMRVRSHYGDKYGAASCSFTEKGEVEDYLVRIVDADSVGWSGGYDMNWNNAANWSNHQVPDYTFDVEIPSSQSVGHSPEIPENTEVLLNSLKLNSGAELSVKGTLKILKK